MEKWMKVSSFHIPQHRNFPRVVRIAPLDFDAIAVQLWYFQALIDNFVFIPSEGCSNLIPTPILSAAFDHLPSTTVLCS